MNHGLHCPCDDCVSPRVRRARTARRRHYAERVWVKNKARPEGGYWRHPNPGKSEHGSSNAYVAYGCRCPVCLEAQNDRVWNSQHRPGSLVGRGPRGGESPGQAMLRDAERRRA